MCRKQPINYLQSITALMRTAHPRCYAFSLVELLVVIALISILVGLLLPAVQAARESARRSQCQSNLHEIGLALASHESAYRELPGGGWGYTWIGDHRLGAGKKQPGGWIFQLLPQIEQGNLWNLSSVDPLEMLRTPVTILSCPSRPVANPSRYMGRVSLANCPLPTEAFRNDYAGNAGDIRLLNDPGPADLNGMKTYNWLNTKVATGIFYQFHATKLSEIVDGLSNTYAIGEKYITLPVATDPADRDFGHDQAALIGDDDDIRRTTHGPPRADYTIKSSDVFGSSHAAGWNVLFADGSVHFRSFDLDAVVHKQLGNRGDGKPVQ